MQREKNPPLASKKESVRSSASKPIILVGGGTGGHIMPLIAIGEELKERGRSFIYVGSKNSREQEIVTALGWPFVAIEAGKWRRYASWKSLWLNLTDGVRVIVGFFQSARLLYKTGATTVMSKGGFVALPMVYAARLMKRRLIIHESDAVMGATNRLAAGFADVVLTAFSPSVYPNATPKFLQVGIPIRRVLRSAAKLKSPSKSRPLLLVMAGIQGSSAINNYLRPILDQLIERVDVVHSVGDKDFQAFKSYSQQLPKEKQARYKPFIFIDRELPYYYQSADLVLSRASATTAVEAAIFSKALYLIPLPTAAGNHQVVNAHKLESAGAAVTREQYQLSSEQLLADLLGLISNEQKLTNLGQALHDYFNEDETMTKTMNALENKELMNG